VTDPAEVALQFVFHINRQKLDELADMMTDNHCFDDGVNSVTVGREVMKENWRRYFELCPDYLSHLSAVYSRDNHVILLGSTTGSHLQIPWHQEFEESIIWVAEIIGERVNEWRIAEVTKAERAKWGIPE